ncbi:MAG: 16S rRNA (cytidine(1402)-2'-O)-methyltransferase [Gammaproteobacteria bacterium]
MNVEKAPLGTLFIVATPIGNLDDITFRAVSVLKSVDFILAEDTRHSKKLLSHFDISTPLRAFHDHNEREKTQSVIDEINAGKSIALISDAGTPLISDPGYVLVSEAKKAGLKVVPLPGPSALITALSGAGLASDNFTFFGFLPNKQTARVKVLQGLVSRTETNIFYESPKRILATMSDMLSVLGENREVCLAKELTKAFETINTGTIPSLIEYLTVDTSHQKGEFVILISGADKTDSSAAEAELDTLLPILCAEMGASKAAKLAAKITGIDKKHCYQRAVDL